MSIEAVVGVVGVVLIVGYIVYRIKNKKKDSAVGSGGFEPKGPGKQAPK